MKAEGDKSKSINVKRVLDKVIEDQNSIYTKDNFRFDLRQLTSYSRIEEAVNHLRKEKIFIKARMPGSLPQESNTRPKRKEYFELSSSLTAFKKIFRIYFDSNNINNLLNSEYTKRILYLYPFLEVHEKVIMQYLDNSNFLKISSRILL